MTGPESISTSFVEGRRGGGGGGGMGGGDGGILGKAPFSLPTSFLFNKAIFCLSLSPMLSSNLSYIMFTFYVTDISH